MKNYCLFLLIALTALCACHNDSFKIEGELDHLDGSAVRVMFRGDSDVVDEWVNVDKKGHFTMEASATQPIIVNIADHKGEHLTTVVVVNGDHIKLKGDASKAMGVKVSGNSVNEEWQKFRDENSALYTDPNTSRLDAAIEEYVQQHPDKMLSTLLLLVDYSDYGDRDKVTKLLRSINAEFRPESLTVAFPGDLEGHGKRNLPRLMTLNLIKHDGDFEEIKLTDRVTLISMWANPQPDRKALINKIQQKDSTLRIIDVLTEGDTLRWHKNIADDPKTWSHYWAPGGPVEVGIELLGITTLPWFAVTDSTGLVTYSGPDLDKALNSARR